MKLIVGLGNYPDKYKNTRHNLGFMAVDQLVKSHSFTSWRYQKKFFAMIATGEIAGKKVIACKPHTLMNLSGKSVLSILQFYKISPEDCIILTDDLDLPFGEVRFRAKGSDAGQRGVRDITKVLKTQSFGRLKFGMASPMKSKMPTDKFVLSPFTPIECQALPDIIHEGLTKLYPHL